MESLCENHATTDTCKKAFFSCISDVTKASWENDDIFNREQYADQLTQLIRNTNCPYVIALSSAWGTGKSYFLHAWKNKIDWNIEADNSDKIPCVYFSAWESEEDFDPALAVLGSVRKALLDKNLLEDKTLKKLTKSVTQFFTSPTKLIKAGFTITKGVASNVTKGATDDIAIQVLEDFVKDPLEAYAKQKENDVDLKSLLEQLISEVHKKTDTPVLVMIDELDRCKPNYVIKLLERIKHFFTIPNLVFVLAIDKKQLLETVEHTFGMKKESREIYLEKFIDLFYELPKPSIMEYAKSLLIENAVEYFIDSHDSYIDKEFARNITSDIYNNMSLTEQIFLRLVEVFLDKDESLRGLEKKLYKFFTIRVHSQPSLFLSIALFVAILQNNIYFLSDDSFIDKLSEFESINSEKHGNERFKDYNRTSALYDIIITQSLTRITSTSYKIAFCSFAGGAGHDNKFVLANDVVRMDPFLNSFLHGKPVSEPLAENLIKIIEDEIYKRLSFAQNMSTTIESS